MDELDQATKAVIYRVAQGGLSNAVRHGRPGRIKVSVTPGEDGSVAVRLSDDGIGMANATEPGLGLAGRRRAPPARSART